MRASMIKTKVNRNIDLARKQRRVELGRFQFGTVSRCQFLNLQLSAHVRQLVAA